jgi:hypothetical protein
MLRVLLSFCSLNGYPNFAQLIRYDSLHFVPCAKARSLAFFVLNPSALLPPWPLAPVLPAWALLCAGLFYAIYCRRRQPTERRISFLGLALPLVICGLVVYPFAIVLGLNVACRPPASNLCGLGALLIAELISASAIVLVGGLITWRSF